MKHLFLINPAAGKFDHTEAFTNAIRDIADGDYISGSVRMLDALLIFFCIAIGVGMAYSLLRGIVGGDLL